MYKDDSIVSQELGKNPRKQESCRDSREQESWKNCKKKRIRQELQKPKIQTRSQEHKNLGWRVISCLASQDWIYMSLARKSRSVFSGKNLV